METFFYNLYRLISNNKLISVLIGLGCIVTFGFFASQIKFEEDITRIIPKSERSDVATKVLKQLNFADKITVILEKKGTGTDEDLAEIAQTFLDSIQSCSQYIRDIEGKIDDENIQETFEFIRSNLPLFLEKSDYELIAGKIQSDSIQFQTEQNFRTLISPTGMVAKDFILNDPLGFAFIALKKLQQLNVGDDFHLKNGFITTKDNSKILLFINPVLAGTETEKNTLFVGELNQIKTDLNAHFENKASVDYFGSSLIAVANAKQIKGDIIKTVVLSLTALMLILMLFYRRVFIPIILFIPTIFGVLFAMACLYFLKETISAISLSVGAILLGVTIDYALHIMTHYKDKTDIKELYKDITIPLIMSSSTTAAAFLCLLFVNSEALKDLGIFAAIAVISSAIFSLIIIPHLYQPKPQPERKRRNIIEMASGFAFEKSKILFYSAFVLIVISFFTFSKVQFNNNLSDLNYVPQEIKDAEAKVESTTSLTSKSIYVAAYGNSEDEALENNSKLFKSLELEQTQNKILSFSSIGGIVLSEKDQRDKIETWNSFWDIMKVESVKADLFVSGASIGFKPSSFQAFYDLLETDFKPISFEQYQELKALPLKDFVTEKEGFHTILSVVKVSDEQREPLIQRVAQEHNSMAIDRQQMNETFLGNLKNDFENLVNYSFLAVILILWIFFRRVELVLVAVIPIAITGVVTAGLMAIFDIQLNIFSTIVCTLIFGHGVDFSIFMTSALQKEHTFGKSDMKTYRTSIILAALTTILAIGSLVFAEHPALKSISMVSLIGVFSAVIITFVFYPVIFKICILNRAKKGKAPITLRLFLHSILSFVYYGIGGFLFSISGQLIMRILPFKKEVKMKWFRFTMSVFMKSVLYTNPFVKKRIVNPNNEQFDRPSVIIANHTSFLDTLAVGMLSYKIIFLVNDWVYNSPIFGRAVKLAGFYPVSQGLDKGVDLLRKKVEEGYSLMIFPEGTRSTTNAIHRFHKGAFYLAKELNLPILPVYIHGNSELLPKGDHIIFNGKLTVHIGDRIEIDDPTFGETYDQKTKLISAFFKNEFQKIRTKNEDAAYFKYKLMLSYLYKERDVVQEIKADFSKNKEYYHQLNDLFLNKERIFHVAADYGQIDILLTLYQAERKIQTYIQKEEKRAVAKTNYLLQTRKIEYVDGMYEINPKTKTCLISASQTDINWKEFLLAFNQIVLFNNSNLVDTICTHGFTIAEKNESIITLKRLQ